MRNDRWVQLALLMSVSCIWVLLGMQVSKVDALQNTVNQQQETLDHQREFQHALIVNVHDLECAHNELMQSLDGLDFGNGKVLRVRVGKKDSK